MHCAQSAVGLGLNLWYPNLLIVCLCAAIWSAIIPSLKLQKLPLRKALLVYTWGIRRKAHCLHCFALCASCRQALQHNWTLRLHMRVYMISWHAGPFLERIQWENPLNLVGKAHSLHFVAAVSPQQKWNGSRITYPKSSLALVFAALSYFSIAEASSYV